MSFVIIKPLGLAVPANRIGAFAFTTENSRAFSLAERTSQTEDIMINTKTVLTCGVSIELPVDILDAANSADALNDIIYDRHVLEHEERRKLLAVKEEPVRRGRGRKAKVVEDEDTEDDEDEIVVASEAVFLPAIRYEHTLESAPLLQSAIMNHFPKQKQIDIIHGKIARFNTLRKQLDELRSSIREPSIEHIESSLGGFGEEGKLESTGLQHYENNLRNKINHFEAEISAINAWVNNEVIARANKDVKPKTAMFTNEISFGSEKISFDDVMNAVRSEVFDFDTLAVGE